MKFLSKLWPEVPADEMTPRARWYLSIVFTYCFGMGLGLVLVPAWFEAKSFEFVLSLVPGEQLGWAVAHAFIGVTALYAARQGSAIAAYRALIGASVVVGIWAFGFDIAVIQALSKADHRSVAMAICEFRFADALHVFRATIGTASWSAAVAYTSLVFTHMVQARIPVRGVFEPVLRTFDAGK